MRCRAVFFPVFTIICVAFIFISSPESAESNVIVLDAGLADGKNEGNWSIAEVMAVLDEEENRLREEENRCAREEAEKRAKLEARLEKYNQQIARKNEIIVKNEAKLADPGTKEKTREGLRKKIDKAKDDIRKLEEKKMEIENEQLVKLALKYQKWNEKIKKKWDNLVKRREKLIELEKKGVKEVRVSLKAKKKGSPVEKEE